MKKSSKKKKQPANVKNLIEIILLVALILVGIAIGWRLLSNDPVELNSTSLNHAQKIYTDPYSVYELTLPKNWTVRTTQSASKQSPVVYLTYPGAPKLYTNLDQVNEIVVTVTNTTDRQMYYGDSFANAKAEQLEGSHLWHGRSDANHGHIDERYLASNGTYDVFMVFRREQTSEAGPAAVPFNESSELSQVKEVLYSIKFLEPGLAGRVDQ